MAPKSKKRVLAEDSQRRSEVAGLRRHRARSWNRHETSIKSMATREGDHYVVNGRKIYISRVEQPDLMILLARTIPVEEVEKRSGGLSVFLVDLREAEGLTVRPRRVMMNNATSELVFVGLRLPAENIIGEEGEGFRYIIDGMNAERILIAAECVGDGRWFI
jgi:acyl-CoA dehydrogenase